MSRTLFPLGEIHKTEVRRIAHEIGLHNAAKKDSTGICFIGERPFREFLNRYLPTEPGPILTPEGQKVGRHEGLSFTRWASARAWAWAASGQAARGRHRRGLVRGAQGPGAQPALCGAGSRPSLAVVEPPAGAGRQLVAGRPPEARGYGAKTRYRQADAACRLEDAADGRFSLVFPQAQWAVTPGQSAVLYDGDICLGGVSLPS